MDERKRTTPDDGFTLDDPLGIAHQPVQGDHIQGLSEEEAATRRRRARAGLDGHDDRSRPGDQNADPDGASGIDMGYGGDGTNLKP